MNKSLTAGLSALVCVLFLAGAWFFASHQSIWIDETTQLSGLALSFDEQFRWLVGSSELQLGVPSDRMPPLSYWMGMLWSALFGLSEASMRGFGITATLAAAPALYLAGQMRAGAIGGLFVLAVVLLSPNTLVIAGEIRAYPLFFMFTAWCAWAFLRCIDPDAGDRPEKLAALSLLLVLTAYTHFFGIVLAGVLLGTLFVQRCLSGAPVRPVLFASLSTAVALIGLVPFVLHAVNLSGVGGATASSSLRDVAVASGLLLYRLFLHGSHSVYVGVFVATALALLGLAALVFYRLILAAAQPRSDSMQSALVLLPLAIAGLTLPVLDLLIGSFAVLAPHYNLWMVPLAAVFLSGAFTLDRTGSLYFCTAHIFAIAAIGGHLVADTILLRNASLYSHGPGEWVADRWLEAERPAVIYESSGPWAQAYFPLNYLSGGEAVQLLRQSDGTLWRILPGGLEPIADPSARMQAFDGKLLVRVQTMYSADLAQIIRGERLCTPQPPKGVGPAKIGYFCAYAAAAVKLAPELRHPLHARP
jgi:hypothetical protein